MKQYDLFKHYERQPKELRDVMMRFEQKYNVNDGFSYAELEEMLKAVEKVGYTFDYYLDAVPYGLRPIGVNLEELGY